MVMVLRSLLPSAHPPSGGAFSGGDLLPPPLRLVSAGDRVSTEEEGRMAFPSGVPHLPSAPPPEIPPNRAERFLRKLLLSLLLLCLLLSVQLLSLLR